MQRHGGAPNAALLQALVKDRSADVRAAAAYVVGLHSSDAAKAVAASALKDANPLVQRRAAEALVRMGLNAGRAELRAGGRHLRAAAERRSIRALFGPRRARTHAARRVDQDGDGRDQRHRADRRPGGARQHRARGAGAVRAAAGVRQAADPDAAHVADAGREDPGAARLRGRGLAEPVRRRSAKSRSRCTRR